MPRVSLFYRSAHSKLPYNFPTTDNLYFKADCDSYADVRLFIVAILKTGLFG